MKKSIKYLITLLVGFIMAGVIAIWSKDILAQTRAAIIFGILADSFCVPGVLFAGLGGLIFVSNEGMFDSIVYGVRTFLDLFRKEKKNQYKTFYDYKESKNRDVSFVFLLICGFVFLAITGIMLYFYNKNL